jgi:tetratricopeptide (TPR) repeat protein
MAPCPPGGLLARTRKGDKVYKLGVQAEARKEYDKALEYFKEAEREDPKEPSYELAARRARFEAGTAHLEAGRKLQKDGDLEKALAEYQKAFNLDPSSMIAFPNISQVKELLDEKAWRKSDRLPVGLKFVWPASVSLRDLHRSDHCLLFRDLIEHRQSHSQMLVHQQVRRVGHPFPQ